ncbi:hypothetical protein, conserved [Eimeria maxima]|uniref:Myb-like domain-containing protein n=1 Tax=Eimeria maxima TaxID=5804 RepID=U6M3C8_EIMMA|nr:hypothetical protein, conserved [Eimeria maxima]CDJ58737.1 hypothetical protein, conserved [Eimeria maxima]
MVSDSREDNSCGDTPQEWLKRLTVKVEPESNDAVCNSEQPAESAGILSSEGISSEYLPISSKSGKVKSKKERKKSSSGKPPKDERVLIPKEAPVYVPALAPSLLPFGSSQVVTKGEETFSADQLQLLELAGPGAKGLWRLHARSGINYRKGPFTTEEKLIIEEALDQYMQREGFSTLEEAVQSLTGNLGKKSAGRFQAIARCLPDRPFVSVYGYIRRRITGSVKRGVWSKEETHQLLLLARRFPSSLRGRWVKIGNILNRRPADVCDRWRTVQPRLHELEAELLHALEDKAAAAAAAAGKGEGEEANLAAVNTAAVVAATRLNTEEKVLLLQEVQQKTGEELPCFGIPWQRIREETFPLKSHACLRCVYNLVILPEELYKRMQANPRPVVLRHVLRCLGRLLLQQQQQLPPGLRGIEWLDILPFVPASLQLSVLKEAAGSIMREEGVPIEVAVPRLLQQHEYRLNKTRKKDAARLLRAALPVYVQQNLEEEIKKKGKEKNWSEDKLKKKMRRKRRATAAKELARLKERLTQIRACPLNAPPRGCPRYIQDEQQQAAEAAARENDPLLLAAAAAAAAAADEENAEELAVAALLENSFTDGLPSHLIEETIQENKEKKKEKKKKKHKNREMDNYIQEENNEEEIETEYQQEEEQEEEREEEGKDGGERGGEEEGEEIVHKKKKEKKKHKIANRMEEEGEEKEEERKEEEEEGEHQLTIDELTREKRRKKKKKKKEKEKEYYLDNSSTAAEEEEEEKEEKEENNDYSCLVVVPSKQKKHKEKKHKEKRKREEEQEEGDKEIEEKEEEKEEEIDELREEKKKKKKRKKEKYSYYEQTAGFGVHY